MNLAHLPIRYTWGSRIFFQLFVNSLIAVMLVLLENNWTYTQALICSNCIGFTIMAIMHLTDVPCDSHADYSWFWRLPLALGIGIPFGFWLSARLGGFDVLAEVRHSPLSQWRILVTTLLISVAVSAFFFNFYRAQKLQTELEAERRLAAEREQSETAARLTLLQAQIEPHFLFNTLANVQSLITSDPALASRMLEHLNRYLRATLARTRQTSATLADELDLLRALLEIVKIRMGARLAYTIDVPPALLSVVLPPLLLQPLVENAIKHGIEPVIEGGSIAIKANIDDDNRLILSVVDDGAGFSGHAGSGVGLANVRARLQALYGAAGQLRLTALPRGVRAELVLPAQLPHGDAAAPAPQPAATSTGALPDHANRAAC